MVKIYCFVAELGAFVLEMSSVEEVDNVNCHGQVVEPVEHVELEEYF